MPAPSAAGTTSEAGRRTRFSPRDVQITPPQEEFLMAGLKCILKDFHLHNISLQRSKGFAPCDFRVSFSAKGVSDFMD